MCRRVKTDDGAPGPHFLGDEILEGLVLPVIESRRDTEQKFMGAIGADLSTVWPKSNKEIKSQIVAAIEHLEVSETEADQEWSSTVREFLGEPKPNIDSASDDKPIGD